MATGNTTKKRYLDLQGLSYFYGKMKALIESTSQNIIDIVGDGYCGITETTEKEFYDSISGSAIVVDFPLNLLNPTLSSITKNNVTCKKNGDGTYTLNGTASADTTFTLETNQALKSNSPYMLSGCPDGGSSATYCLGIKDSTTNSGTVYDYGDGVEYTPSTENKHTVFMFIKSGAQFTNTTFKPMLEAGLTVHSFVPYNGYSITITSTDNLKSNVINVTPSSVGPLIGLESFDGGSRVICGTEVAILYPTNIAGSLITNIISSVESGEIPKIIEMSSAEYHALTEDQIIPDVFYFVPDEY